MRMNPDQAQKLVKQTFQADFDRERFRGFIDRLLKTVNFEKHFTQSGFNIRRAFLDKVNSFERVGQYTDSEGKKIDILIVNLKKDVTLERGRTGLRNFAADYLQSDRGIGKSAVLVAYVSSSQTDWRFSYVTLEKDLKQTDKGTYKEEITSLTPARRYSFLVGKNENSHTAQKQFFDLLNNDEPKLQHIEDAFNIEKVTKEFFGQYKELFESLRNELDKICRKSENIRDEFIKKGMFAFAKDSEGNEKLNKDGDRIKEPHTDDFAKKLLGQIVFLYFLQKKGWFGVGRDEKWGTGDKHFLRSLFQNKQTGENFFDSILEPLFYNALAVKRQDDWSDRFNSKIPFLNGGLFEPLNDYDWIHTDIHLPDKLFSNSESTKENDKGTGILDVFDRYNFTINEAEPLEVEVAVDPEMLGKIFENLLPENIRHGSGTYYTPRVIVAYMCQQSLINYLASHLPDVSRDDIENFIRFGSQQRDYTEAGTQSQAEKFLPQSVVDNAKEIDKHLSTITVCDPAIGSGAFPVGMMLEIVKAREALQSVEGIKQQSQYDLKRQTIENSLYGVDIDSGAVEIAKLRLWLSLIVDETDFQKIEPLPNLDYKIMQGNSLLDSFHGVKLIDEKLFEYKRVDKEVRIREIDAEIVQLTKDLGKANVGKQSSLYELTKRGIAELTKKRKMVIDGQVDSFQSDLFAPVDESHQKLEELKKKHKEIFNETRKEVKERLRVEAEKLEWEFIEAKLKADGKTAELAELEGHRKERRKNYFLWQLNFPEIFQVGGFDVVIGNPPYGVSIKGDYRAQVLRVLGKVPDYEIYYYFLELAHKCLKTKGLQSYIIPNTFLFNVFAANYRTKLLEIWRIHCLVDCTAFKIFESAVVHNAITFLQKCEASETVGYKPTQDAESFQDLVSRPTSIVTKSALIVQNQNWGLAFKLQKEVLQLIVKLKSNGIALEEKFPEFSQGLIAYDKYQGQSKKTIETRAYHFDHKAKAGLKRWIWGSDVTRFNVTWNGKEWIDYCNGIANPRQPKFFKGERLLIREITNPSVFCAYTSEELYHDPAIIVVLKSNSFSLRVLLGILNSRLATFYHFNSSPKATKGAFPKILVEDVKNFPLPIVSEVDRSSLEKLVNRILEKKDNNSEADTSALDNAIDEKVYELYGLTRKEIAIVEGRV